MHGHSYLGYYWTTYYCLLGDGQDGSTQPRVTEQEKTHQAIQRRIGIKDFGGMDATGIECKDGAWMPWDAYYTRYAECQKELARLSLVVHVGLVLLMFVTLGVLVCIGR